MYIHNVFIDVIHRNIKYCLSLDAFILLPPTKEATLINLILTQFVWNNKFKVCFYFIIYSLSGMIHDDSPHGGLPDICAWQPPLYFMSSSVAWVKWNINTQRNWDSLKAVLSKVLVEVVSVWKLGLILFILTNEDEDWERLWKTNFTWFTGEKVGLFLDFKWQQFFRQSFIKSGEICLKLCALMKTILNIWTFTKVSFETWSSLVTMLTLS